MCVEQASYATCPLVTGQARRWRTTPAPTSGGTGPREGLVCQEDDSRGLDDMSPRPGRCQAESCLGIGHPIPRHSVGKVAAGTELRKIMLGTFLERRDRPRDQTKA
jgi:hypothetical protein